MSFLDNVRAPIIMQARKHGLCKPGHEEAFADERINEMSNTQLLDAIERSHEFPLVDKHDGSCIAKGA